MDAVHEEAYARLEFSTTIPRVMLFRHSACGVERFANWVDKARDWEKKKKAAAVLSLQSAPSRVSDVIVGEEEGAGGPRCDVAYAVSGEETLTPNLKSAR